ncbi:sodium/potassium/calcium exchanger 4 [Plakobranchus ocellatus]|uniref:Sodium/potassium/calcium exchanger 4 n=1 Tax=Plakobranchus ocellatus TaxID=259542 RepID=A0AAV4CHM2_9GAST|nr:sodium/potassium/calcium exchanger 4 [Plakobranchus ocellatus]
MYQDFLALKTDFSPAVQSDEVESNQGELYSSDGFVRKSSAQNDAHWHQTPVSLHGSPSIRCRGDAEQTGDASDLVLHATAAGMCPRESSVSECNVISLSAARHETTEEGKANAVGGKRSSKYSPTLKCFTRKHLSYLKCGSINAPETHSYYVYDGGGEEESRSVNQSGKGITSKEKHFSDDPWTDMTLAVNNPTRANLLPQPLERIGPPNRVTCNCLSVLPTNTDARDLCDYQSEVWKDGGQYSAQTFSPSSHGLNKDIATSMASMSGNLDMAMKSGKTCSRLNCSNNFIHCTLRYKSKCRNYKFMALAACYLSAVLLVVTLRGVRQSEEALDQQEDTKLHHTRMKRAYGVQVTLKNNTRCEKEYDKDQNEIYIMSYDTFMKGGWIVHVCIGMYTFAAIAAICDIYFVPALEHICEDLKLEADVAGATFMAAASSAPEFCTSVIGIFVQESDVGLGAIVGSSIFNLLAIVGLCAVFAGMPVELSWYPLTRDSIFYTVAVCEMLAFMYDSTIHWFEALVMIITYGFYILVMVYNKRIEKFVQPAEIKRTSRQSSFMDIHRTQSARLEIIRARSHSRSSGPSLRMSVTRLRELQGGRHTDTTIKEASFVSSAAAHIEEKFHLDYQTHPETHQAIAGELEAKVVLAAVKLRSKNYQFTVTDIRTC